MYVSLARSSDLAGKSAFIVVMSRGDVRALGYSRALNSSVDSQHHRSTT